MRQRIAYFEEGLREIHRSLKSGQRLLIEYKPFEPAFYHTDIADWGMAYLLAKEAGPQAFVLVIRAPLSGAEHRTDRGVVASSQNDWRISFHDRRYADDDLTLGSNRSLPGIPDFSSV